MPTFKIQHVTKYEYDRPVKESVNEIMIFPYLANTQEILQHDLHISDSPELQIYFDYWGNKAATFNLLQPHKELVIESKLIVRTTALPQLQVNFHSGWQQLQEEINGQLQLLELTKAEHSSHHEVIVDIISAVNQQGNSVAYTVERCCEYIYKNFKYIKGITNIETTVDEILQIRSGVCQDFAHVMLQLLRTLGIPSRYVSGYICPNKTGMRGEGATHAWVEAWIPQYGWAGIDPTNNIWVTNTHVKLAVGRNFNDCTPVKGTFKGPARQTLSVYVFVGYENGHTFQEVNNVRMQIAAALEPEDIITDGFAGQQQQ
jgi:transglutaminase-like putative cysteine protease